MNTETKTLPYVPSQIIRLALADLEKIEHDERYTVEMGTWHSPQGPHRCEVCFAGAVMASTLGADFNLELDPGNFGDAAAKLSALNDLRSGDVGPLLRACRVPDGLTADVVYELEDAGIVDQCEPDSVADYHTDPAQFKSDMRAIAAALEARGL